MKETEQFRRLESGVCGRGGDHEMGGGGREGQRWRATSPFLLLPPGFYCPPVMGSSRASLNLSSLLFVFAVDHRFLFPPPSFSPDFFLFPPLLSLLTFFSPSLNLSLSLSFPLPLLLIVYRITSYWWLENSIFSRLWTKTHVNTRKNISTHALIC